MAAGGWTEVGCVSQVSSSSGGAWGKQSSLDLKSRLVWGSGRNEELQGTALKQRGEEQEGSWGNLKEWEKEWESKGGRKTGSSITGREKKQTKKTWSSFHLELLQHMCWLCYSEPTITAKNNTNLLASVLFDILDLWLKHTLAK